MGTSAMYEYATTIMGPTYFEASFSATRMDVGPSAAPMMAMAAASFKGKPIRAAKLSVTK